MHPDCPFCLKNNLLKSKIVAEADDAFLINALGSHGNYLIVPRVHAESLAELPDHWWAQVKQLLPHIPGLNEHYNMSINVGKHAGQTVKHLHFWFIPRVEGLPASGKGLATLISEAK